MQAADVSATWQPFEAEARHSAPTPMIRVATPVAAVRS